MKELKKIPKFKNEDEEREFWAEHDSTEYIDWEKAEEAIFPDLKPTTKTISLRLPVSMLYRLKQLAHQVDVPYQSLIKMILAEKLAEISCQSFSSTVSMSVHKKIAGVPISGIKTVRMCNILDTPISEINGATSTKPKKGRKKTA